MKEAKDKHASNDHANLATDLLNLTCHILAGITSAVIFPSTSPAASPETTPQPSIPSFRDLTEDEIAALNKKFPGHSAYVQKYAEALDVTHKILLDNHLISPEKLAELKKNYINLYTHQLNQTKNVACNQNNYHTKSLEAALLSHAGIKSAEQTTRSTQGTSNKNEIDNSLAYAWKDLDKKNENSLTKWLNTMSDAHGFIQVMGWATQNENSPFAIIFDSYNYLRYKKDIAGARFILISLIAPFYPLFTEYQDIAGREKNTFLKVLRTVIPMLIVASFIIGVTALIPLALPELAFFILAIPLLYLGLALASLYVKTKELIYRGYRHVMYEDDINLFPEFEANDDLKTIFKEDVSKIREYYIQAIQACNTIEACYKEKGLLEDDTEEEKRTANLERSHALLLEWFDLRDNKKLNKKNKRCIALKRLESDEANASKTFKRDIKNLVHAIEKDVNAKFYAEEEPEQEETEATKANTYTPSSPRFFPSCPQQRDEISKLQALEKAIEAKFN